jgi:hypothetical protein
LETALNKEDGDFKLVGVSKKKRKREIIKRSHLFPDFSGAFIVVPLSPVKWGSRRVTLNLREEFHEFSNVLFSIHRNCLVVFKESLDCIFGMRIVAVPPIAEAISDLRRGKG